MDQLVFELRDLLTRHSIRHGEFTLVSGAKSNYYCNSKLTLLSPRGARLVGEILFRICVEYDAEAIGGLQLGATFMATATALVSDERQHPIYGFNVRDGQKGHGMKQKIDESFHPDGGPLLVPGRRVVVVDDVVTAGGSIFKAIEAVKEIGCDIVAVVALVDRRAGGTERLLESGLRYRPLFYADGEGRLHVE
jgi:orotate phosphoribosyltransferase